MFIYNHSLSYALNKGVIIGIIIVVVIAIGGAVAISFYEISENDGDLPDVVEDSEPKRFTVDLSENVGFRESPP